MSGLILPTARMGVVHQLGEILSKDFKNGVTVFVRGNMVALRIIKDGQKFYEIEFGEKQSAEMAEYFRKGCDLVQQSGGSGLPDTRIVEPTTA